MANHEHLYRVQIEWSGNLGTGTSGYRAYSRAHEISAVGKATIPGSSDPAFRGDATRYNPEELLVSALATCHMLWYLHLCAQAAIVVLAYRDYPSGVMVENATGGGRFREVALQPRVRLAAGADAVHAMALHTRAHELCFVANSVNFPVVCAPVIEFDSGGGT